MEGALYRYTYEINDKEYTVSVWDRPWINSRRVTGLQKVEEKMNENGQRVKVTTTTRIEERNFTEIAKDLI